MSISNRISNSNSNRPWITHMQNSASQWNMCVPSNLQQFIRFSIGRSSNHNCFANKITIVRFEQEKPAKSLEKSKLWNYWLSLFFSVSFACQSRAWTEKHERNQHQHTFSAESVSFKSHWFKWIAVNCEMRWRWKEKIHVKKTHTHAQHAKQSAEKERARENNNVRLNNNDKNSSPAAHSFTPGPIEDQNFGIVTINMTCMAIELNK